MGIARCMGMSEQDVKDALVRRRDVENTFDVAWDDALYFFVRPPLQETKLKIEYLPASSGLFSSRSPSTEINVWYEGLANTANKQTWHGFLTLGDISLRLSL